MVAGTVRSDVNKQKDRIADESNAVTGPIELQEFSTPLLNIDGDDPTPPSCTRGTIPFSKACAIPPTVLLGISSLDMNIARIHHKVCSVADTHAYVELSTWGDGFSLYGSTCAALIIHSEEHEIQSGRFSTCDDHPWDKPQNKTSRRIIFERPYDPAPAPPPRVVVWLDTVDTESKTNCRIAAYATDITHEGFTIHLDTWHDTKLWIAGASWLAYPAHRKDIWSGTFHTDDIRSRDRPPQLKNDGRVAFRGDVRESVPKKIFVAFNHFDVDVSKNIRVKVRVDEVTPTGMGWHIEGWDDTILYGAGAAFIGFE